MRPHRARSLSMLGIFLMVLAVPWPALAQVPVQDDEPVIQGVLEAVEEAGPGDAEAGGIPSIVVLPFRIHSARPLGYLVESMADLLATRLESTGAVDVVDSSLVREAVSGSLTREFSDAELRRLAARVGARAVVTGSLTELAGRFSLDVRVTPAAASARSHTLVFTAESEEELLGSLDELVERVSTRAAGAGPGVLLSIEVVGAGDLDTLLRNQLRSEVGGNYDPDLVREDRQLIEEHPAVASVSVETDRSGAGIALRYRIVRSEMIFGGEAAQQAGEVLADVEIRGNRRIEADAIRSRIRTRAGEPMRRTQVAADVREVFGLGFFRNVVVYEDDRADGKVLIFEVQENPVIRQISISGNDNVESDKVKDVLTLTTGSTLDHPLLHENVDRIEALYRASGYYLAKVNFEVETLTEGSVAVHFEVGENEKLKLRKIGFEGNDHFSAGDLTDDFATKRWRFWSYATSWFDQSGTYSEPVFMRDLRSVEKKYTDNGYLQVEVGQPKVDATEEGLSVNVDITEGPQFRVGTLDVSGDKTADLELLRKLLQLEEGAVFNRSALTEDVETLESYYTDRGFYFASVQPATRLSQDDQVVDVEFQVKKGPLYFIRHINISGNTTTVDPVIRREMRVVEGELYSARALQVSNVRIRNLGFFEDISFEPRPTNDPSQLDLHVGVVERPTGAFSFGAGYSSQDGLVFTASLSQANLFGRGYGVNLSADLGGRANRFSFSFSDPYVAGTEFSLGSSIFLFDEQFQDFDREVLGFDINLGHSLREDNTARGFLRYSLSSRKIKQDTSVVASAPIHREIRQGNESTSLIGLSFRSDTRDDRLAPTSGSVYGATVEYAGIGGFSNFLRFEGRFAKYWAAPGWMIDRSAFVFSTRIGYAIPFNTVFDYDLAVPESTQCDEKGSCVNAGTLFNIDDDLRLPLTERYFLGGIGTFQLRGYRARTVGPRRAQLYDVTIGGGAGGIFTPRGRQFTGTDSLGRPVYGCTRGPLTQSRTDDTSVPCNDIGDKEIEDFGNLRETDVVGGNSFVTASFEYRFPISEEVGLQGVIFVDMGNAFYEDQNLFDVTKWRYSWGGGLLWFSPFGPLQVVLGVPIDPLPFEDSPVFEFSVGGFGI